MFAPPKASLFRVREGEVPPNGGGGGARKSAIPSAASGDSSPFVVTSSVSFALPAEYRQGSVTPLFLLSKPDPLRWALVWERHGKGA